MVRISKQSQRRARCPRKHCGGVQEKTGSKKDNLPKGYKEHSNALEGDLAAMTFIGKVK